METPDWLLPNSEVNSFLLDPNVPNESDLVKLRQGNPTYYQKAWHGSGDFNSHTPRGVRLIDFCVDADFPDISTHAPREECDDHRSIPMPRVNYFNSRTLRRVRPRNRSHIGALTMISTHVPREGCDSLGQGFTQVTNQFQLTHPAWGATSRRYASPVSSPVFQLTHPARGATPGTHGGRGMADYFNSRTPRGMRRSCRRCSSRMPEISTHAPREGCDCAVKRCCIYRMYQSFFREPGNGPSLYRASARFFCLCASASRYRISVSLGSQTVLVPRWRTLLRYLFPRL